MTLGHVILGSKGLIKLLADPLISLSLSCNQFGWFPACNVHQGNKVKFKAGIHRNRAENGKLAEFGLMIGVVTFHSLIGL